MMQKILGFALTLTIGLHAVTHAAVQLDQQDMVAFAARYVQTQREAGFSDEQILKAAFAAVEAQNALIEEAPVTLRTTQDNQQRIIYFVAGVASTMVAGVLVYYIIELLKEKPEEEKPKLPVPNLPTKPQNGTTSGSENNVADQQPTCSRNVDAVRSMGSGDDHGNSANSVSGDDDGYNTEVYLDGYDDKTNKAPSDPHALPANREPIVFRFNGSKNDKIAKERMKKKKEIAKKLGNEALAQKKNSDFTKAADHELPGSDVFSSAPEAPAPQLVATPNFDQRRAENGEFIPGEEGFISASESVGPSEDSSSIQVSLSVDASSLTSSVVDYSDSDSDTTEKAEKSE
ncbi:hypothetical protein IPF37_00900 [bacterium]|nr:MAG: hypothetical protein IPF37_00900 [bacterium]